MNKNEKREKGKSKIKKSGIFFPLTSIASGLMKPAFTGAESFALAQWGRKGDGKNSARWIGEDLAAVATCDLLVLSSDLFLYFTFHAIASPFAVFLPESCRCIAKYD